LKEAHGLLTPVDTDPTIVALIGTSVVTNFIQASICVRLPQYQMIDSVEEWDKLKGVVFGWTREQALSETDTAVLGLRLLKLSEP
jgi:hypothetical protein